jgi:hypothetical protein
MEPRADHPVAIPPESQPVERTEGDPWREFKVPWGEAPDGRLVRARSASPEVSYRCPGCGSGLKLRAGSIRSPHFAHLGHALCSGETALHQGAKLRIAQLLRKCANGKRNGAPWLRVPCAGFPRPEASGFAWSCPGEAWLPLWQLEFDQVAVERTTPDGLRPDVLLLHRGPVLGIEVLVTHAVDEPKAVRTTHPWVELEARQILASPRRWKPCQVRHPWSGICRVCQSVRGAALSEPADAGDLLAQLAASCFAAHVQEWLRPGARVPDPAVHWRCPWCRKRNQRHLRRDRIQWAAPASALGPPIHPQVIILDSAGTPVTVAFTPPANPFRPLAIAPLPEPGPPAIRATPGLDRPHRLVLNATNAPMAFICRKCGRDCLGRLPSPLVPLPHWECL